MNILETTLSTPAPWAGAALRLLQGVVYGEDSEWRLLREHETSLREHFLQIGLELVVDESEAFAWLRQRESEEGETALPRLVRRAPLTWEQTLLCVLLRDRLLQFDRANEPDGRLVLTTEDFREMLLPFLPESGDAAKLERRINGLRAKAEELGFVRGFSAPSGTCYEVRRILKARLPVEDLERIRDTVLAWKSSVNGED
ncbi:MAG: DUF4194 domain-containing protein [Fibrobacterota bacterium]|nr:DUF4194 domain-containing protein [Fibrobacterota bacterium]QQS06041.1 MAG: DUF4194 domain-containing protein [Fibrobacterota bacterium]